MRGRRLDRLTKGPTFADLDIITHLPEKCKGFLKKSFVKPNIFLQSPGIGKNAADFASQNPLVTGLDGAMGAFHGKAPIAGSAPARQLRLTQTAMSDLPRFAKAK